MAILALGLFVNSCDDDDNDPIPRQLVLKLSGLEDLGNDFVYEGWIIVNGNAISKGTFTSTSFPQKFNVNNSDLAAATKFVLSIEPAVDNDPAPAPTKI